MNCVETIYPGKLTIIPRARMCPESIAHSAFALMGYRLRGHEGEKNNCFSEIQLVGQTNIETKHLSLVKARQNAIQPPLFWLSKPALFATSGL